MKKCGFTLVELIAVIVLIALLATIAIVPISKIIKGSQDEAYNAQINQIILATQNWASDNQLLLYEYKNNLEISSNNDYDTVPILTKTIDELIDEEYLDDEIKDVKTDKDVIKGCSKIEIYFNKDSESASTYTYRYKFIRLETC